MKNVKSGKNQIIDQGKLTKCKRFLPETINKPLIVQDQSTLTMPEEATRLLSERNASERETFNQIFFQRKKSL